MMTSETQRLESWGVIEYDKEQDEFEAYFHEDKALIVDRPVSVGCLVTGRCNLLCRYCYGNDEALPQERDEISSAEWKQVFERLRDWGVMRVDISGGEPSVRKDLSDIIAAALDTGLITILSTNATLLSEASVASFPVELGLHISIDSGFAQRHESSRILRSRLPSTGSLARIEHIIRTAIAHGNRVRVLTCVGPHNCTQLFELGERLAMLGVAEWNISRILSAGRAFENYKDRWFIENGAIHEQITAMRKAYPWVRIRYSRTGASRMDISC